MTIDLYKKIILSVFLLLFIYSGANALLFNRKRKIQVLNKKLPTWMPTFVSDVLIIGGSILEILVPLVIIFLMVLGKENHHQIIKYCFYFLILFMLIVTLLYYITEPIPLLTNLSLLSGLLYIYIDMCV